MSNAKFSTPIVFIIFNRPDNAERVFAEISKVKPLKLLVIGDGPRDGHPGDDEKVLAARAIIKRVDWDCEVLTNFSEVNLGCKWRVSSGLNWVFEQVEEAIILEDDCLPDPTFFVFCHELLKRYRYDQRIGMIGGSNFQYGYRRNDDSYYFSSFHSIWGWATWRDRWQENYDINLMHWPRVRDEGWVKDLIRDEVHRKYFIRDFEPIYQGTFDTWDAQWSFAMLLHGRLTILPNINLIANIGFGSNATHTKDISEMANIRTAAMQFPLRHPIGMIESHSLDVRASTRLSLKPPLLQRIKDRLSRPRFGRWVVGRLARIIYCMK